MNIAQSIYDDLVNECGASFDVDADVVRAIIAVSVSGVLNAQIKHTAELEKQLAIAQGALRAQDENHRAQLAALGLTERFPSLTHLADDMGEALLLAERARDAAIAENGKRVYSQAEMRLAIERQTLEEIGRLRAALNDCRSAASGIAQSTSNDPLGCAYQNAVWIMTRAKTTLNASEQSQ
jgi:hypothetical protein